MRCTVCGRANYGGMDSLHTCLAQYPQFNITPGENQIYIKLESNIFQAAIKYVPT